MVIDVLNALTDDLEHPYFALESYTYPKVDATHVEVGLIILVVNENETELARVERRAFADAQAQQMIHELLNLLHGPWFHQSAAHEAQDGGGLPHVAPAPGEHTCPHDVLRRQEGKYVLQHAVLEAADVVVAFDRSRQSCGGGRRNFGRFPRKHPAGRPIEDDTRLATSKKLADRFTEEDVEMDMHLRQSPEREAAVAVQAWGGEQQRAARQEGTAAVTPKLRETARAGGLLA
jgi:hypothetical protein